MRKPFFIDMDLDVFFKGAFSETCFVLNDEEDKEIDCIFNEDLSSINYNGVDLNDITSSILLKNEDIKNNQIKKNTRLNIRGDVYIIKNLKYNSPGIKECELEKFYE